jgi:hypothetical protein
MNVSSSKNWKSAEQETSEQQGSAECFWSVVAYKTAKPHLYNLYKTE